MCGFVKMVQLQRHSVALIALLGVIICLVRGDDVTDAQVRRKLHTRAQTVVAVLNWSQVTRPWITDNRLGRSFSMYEVSWDGGFIYFSPGFSLKYCSRTDSRKIRDFRNPPPLPKLSASDAKRAQAIARRTCEALGLGKIASFKEVVVKRTPSGMYFPIVSVECRMRVDSPIPVHELSVPSVSMELEPGSLTVNRLSAPLPIVVEPLKTKEDKESAKKAIAEHAKKRYGLALNPDSMKVNLWLLDWPEGVEGSDESKRLRSLRRWLVPIYEYSEPKIGKFWLNANTMKILGVRENYPQHPVSRRGAPP